MIHKVRRDIKVKILPVEGALVFDPIDMSFIVCEKNPEEREAAVKKAAPRMKAWLSNIKIKKTASETILTVKNNIKPLIIIP